MITLILETAGRHAQIIMAKGSTILACRESDGSSGLSTRIMAEIEQLLKDNRLAFKDLEHIAAGCGPGSYTGLRVGAAVAVSLSFGLNIPLSGFSSLSAFAPPHAGKHMALMDARSGGIYCQQFDENSRPQEDAALLSTEEVQSRLAEGLPVFTPDAELLNKKLNYAGLRQTTPNPEKLASLAQNHGYPFKLAYLH